MTTSTRVLALIFAAGAFMALPAVAQENGIAAAGNFRGEPLSGGPDWQAGVE